MWITNITPVSFFNLLTFYLHDYTAGLSAVVLCLLIIRWLCLYNSSAWYSFVKNEVACLQTITPNFQIENQNWHIISLYTFWKCERFHDRIQIWVTFKLSSSKSEYADLSTQNKYHALLSVIWIHLRVPSISIA